MGNYDDNDLYTICVKGGILKYPQVSCNQFEFCSQALLKESKVNQIEPLLHVQLSSEESASGGQGYVKCNCAGHTKC